MSEEREVLGYTLTRRQADGPHEDYWTGGRSWSEYGSGVRVVVHRSMLGLLRNLVSMAGRIDPPVSGCTYHIGRVVRIPGKQKVEVLTEPEAGCAWGVRCSWVAPGPWAGTDGWAGNRGPVPMTLEQAKIARVQRGVMDGQALYLVPLRVTESGPRTVVEEVECE